MSDTMSDIGGEDRRQEPDRLMRRHEVARILARTPRAVDLLAQAGILRRVILPGRERGSGFVASEVMRLLKG